VRSIREFERGTAAAHVFKMNGQLHAVIWTSLDPAEVVDFLGSAAPSLRMLGFTAVNLGDLAGIDCSLHEDDVPALESAMDFFTQ
jgi:hypothetical protein